MKIIKKIINFLNKKRYYIILLFILLFLILFFHFKKYKIENYQNEKPYIWYYWETLPNKKKPAYIDICYDSIVHNCKDCFHIIHLDEKNIYNYLPELKEEHIQNFDKLSIPHKTDYYRYALLEKYGGIWIDADTIVTRCLCPLYKKLEESNKDYIGVGCGRSKGSCERNPDGKGNPVNGLMMSKEKTKFMKCVRDKTKKVIEENENFGYHAIGRSVLQECIEEMDSEWDYIHVSPICQEYDSNGKKLNNIMKPYNVKDCSKERYFFFLYNTAPGYPEWFKELSKDDLLNERGPEKYYLKEIFDEAFSQKEKCL